MRWLVGSICLALLAISGSLPARASADLFTPGPGSPLMAGSEPDALAVGDFNGDGYLDIAAANQDAATVTGLLGFGNGQLSTLPSTPVGNDPTALVSADFNGDGLDDLAVADGDDNDVRIMLATGDGGFTLAPGSPIPVGTMPMSIAAADFTGAGTPDLAVANYGSGSVSILIGNGAGGFSQASPLTVNTPVALAVEDFNGDGIPDLAVLDEADDEVWVFLGTGTGDFTLAPGSPISVGSSPVALATADFNRDGIPDLAVVNRADGTVSVLLGNGDGSFRPAPGSPIFLGGALSALAVGDFNGDGTPDMAVADSEGNSVPVLLGNGDGSFSAAPGSPESVGTDPDALAVGAFTNAGLDLAAANWGDGTLTTLINQTANATATCNACQPPTFGETVNLAPVHGSIEVEVPRRRGGRTIKGQRFVPLRTMRQLPVGTIVDANRGTVEVSSATRVRSLAVQTAELGGSGFRVLQPRQEHGLTQFALTAVATKKECTSVTHGRIAYSRRRPQPLSHKVIALLRASDHGGRFSTTTGYSGATVRGTVWDTAVRCDGTLTRVVRGVVDVRDFRLRRTIVLRAGHSYLARR